MIETIVDEFFFGLFELPNICNHIYSLNVVEKILFSVSTDINQLSETVMSLFRYAYLMKKRKQQQSINQSEIFPRSLS